MVVGGGMALTEAARSCEMDLFPAPISSKKINLFLFYATFHKNSLVIVLDYRGKVATHSPNN